MSQSFQVRSPAFAEGQPIPELHSCEGRDISPPLVWTEPPAGTRSLALICDDPDAPGGVWVHWVLYNLPSTTRELPQNVAPEPVLALGERQGRNSWGRIGYGGPCPPSGTHRYFFRLFALDVMLETPAGCSRVEIEAAMRGHVIGHAQLMGTYKKGIYRGRDQLK